MVNNVPPTLQVVTSAGDIVYLPLKLLVMVNNVHQHYNSVVVLVNNYQSLKVVLCCKQCHQHYNTNNYL